MTQLLIAYIANPSFKNIQKLRSYSQKHPMAHCMLTPAESDVLRAAIEQKDAA